MNPNVIITKDTKARVITTRDTKVKGIITKEASTIIITRAKVIAHHQNLMNINEEMTLVQKRIIWRKTG